MAQTDELVQLDPEKISQLSTEELAAHLRARGIDDSGKKYPLVRKLREALLKEAGSGAPAGGASSTATAPPPPASTSTASSTQPPKGSWQNDLAPGAVPKSAQLQPRPMVPPSNTPRPRAWAPYPQNTTSSGTPVQNSGSGSHPQHPQPWPTQPSHWPSMAPPRRPAMPVPQQAPPQRPVHIPPHLQHAHPGLEWYPPEVGDGVNGDSCDRSPISDDRPTIPKQSDADVAARFAALLARPGKKTLPSKPDGIDVSTGDLRSRMDRLVTKQAERVRSRSRARKSSKHSSKPQSKSKPTKPLIENSHDVTNSIERPPLNSLAPPKKDYIDTFLEDLGDEDATESEGREDPSSRVAQPTRKSLSSPSRRQSSERSFGKELRIEADRSHEKPLHLEEMPLDGRRGNDGHRLKHHAQLRRSPGAEHEVEHVDGVEALRRRRQQLKAARMADRDPRVSPNHSAEHELLDPLLQDSTDGFLQPMDGVEAVEANERVCPVIVRRCILGWFARLQECTEAPSGSVDLKRASSEVRDFAKHRDMQLRDRRREIRQEARQTWERIEEANFREVRNLDRELQGAIRGDHQWLEYAVDMQKHGMIEALDSFISAVTGDPVQLHEAYTTLEELHARAHQARSGLRDSILTQLELDEQGGDSTSTARRQEVHDVRLSMLKVKQVEERRLLEDVERDLDRYDPQLRSIEDEFLDKVRSVGGTVLPSVRTGKEDNEKTAVIKALRHAAASIGLDLEELVCSLELFEQDSSLTHELQSVLKMARRLSEVVQEHPAIPVDELDAITNGDFSGNGEADATASPSGLGSPSRGQQKDALTKGEPEERPALARRTKIGGAPGGARGSSPVVLTRRPLRRGTIRRGYDDEAPGRPPPRDDPRGGRPVDRGPPSLIRRCEERSRSRRNVFKPALRVVSAAGHSRSGSPRQRHRHPQLAEHNSAAARPRFRPRDREDSPGYRGGYGQQRSR